MCHYMSSGAWGGSLMCSHLVYWNYSGGLWHLKVVWNILWRGRPKRLSGPRWCGLLWVIHIIENCFYIFLSSGPGFQKLPSYCSYMYMSYCVIICPVVHGGVLSCALTWYIEMVPGVNDIWRWCGIFCKVAGTKQSDTKASWTHVFLGSLTSKGGVEYFHVGRPKLHN